MRGLIDVIDVNTHTHTYTHIYTHTHTNTHHTQVCNMLDALLEEAV